MEIRQSCKGFYEEKHRLSTIIQKPPDFPPAIQGEKENELRPLDLVKHYN